ncbi:MAG: MBOAT family protein [Bacteroidales bacterium]|nr:MBOAT family protein [Bacteroidales bacterium]
MLFNSIEYLIYLPLVIIFYYLLPHRFRWIFLLAASYYFYMSWEVKYALLILFTTTYNYFIARWFTVLKSEMKRKMAFISVFVVNLGLLFFFKYYHFITGSAITILDAIHIPAKFPDLNFLLPVGISFYTFQTLSYMIEVKQGKQEVEKHFGYFALYVVYFPQLVAGPIERYARLAPQLKSNISFSYANLRKGLQLILYGLFVKMVIADNLSPLVDQVFAKPAEFQSWSIITAVFFYSFQIYSDFFGYSTIAIGSSLLIGIKLMDNFNTPYLSRSISEFWNRWHISLSTWFRDYVFFSLGGSWVKFRRLWLNIMIVFMVSGLWHGANWTFVIWGALHGLYYMTEKSLGNWFPVFNVKRNRIIAVISMLGTFLLASFAWIFFRSASLADAILFIKSIYLNFGSGSSLSIPVINWLLLGLFILSDILLYNTRFDTWLDNKSLIVRWFVYIILLFSIAALSGVNNHPFIYFQF